MKKPITLSMTGEEFKQLVEQRRKNNKIDTLQEVLAAFDGIDDDETIAGYVKRVSLDIESIEEEDLGIGITNARSIVAEAIRKAEHAL